MAGGAGSGGAFTRAQPANLYRLNSAAVTPNVTAYATPPPGKTLCGWNFSIGIAQSPQTYISLSGYYEDA